MKDEELAGLEEKVNKAHQSQMELLMRIWKLEKLEAEGIIRSPVKGKCPVCSKKLTHKPFVDDICTEYFEDTIDGFGRRPGRGKIFRVYREGFLFTCECGYEYGISYSSLEERFPEGWRFNDEIFKRVSNKLQLLSKSTHCEKPEVQFAKEMWTYN